MAIHRRDVTIGMKIEWFEPGETVGQVVDFAKLSSRVSRDGQVVTDARFFVKSRGRVPCWTLPAGRPVGNQGRWRDRERAPDGGEILVPLPAKADPNEPVEVTLRYGLVSKGDPPAAGGSRPGRARRDRRMDGYRRRRPPAGAARRQTVSVRPAWRRAVGNGWQGTVAVGVLLVLGLGALGCAVRAVACGGLPAAFGTRFHHHGGVLGLPRGVQPGKCGVLEYAAPVVAAGGRWRWRSATSPLAAPGRRGGHGWFSPWCDHAVRGLMTPVRWWIMCGLALIGAAFLSFRGGARLFFGSVADRPVLVDPPAGQAIRDKQQGCRCGRCGRPSAVSVHDARRGDLPAETCGVDDPGLAFPRRTIARHHRRDVACVRRATGSATASACRPQRLRGRWPAGGEGPAGRRESLFHDRRNSGSADRQGDV